MWKFVENLSISILGLFIGILLFSFNISKVSTDPGLFLEDFLEKELHIYTKADVEKEKDRIKCLQDGQVSKEQFKMKFHVCQRFNASVTCTMGESHNCYKDIQAYKATAKVTRNELKCLIDANTTEWKYIQFVVEAKLLLNNQNEAGSRSLAKKIERQRGRCTLGYTCSDTFTKSVKIDCVAMNFDDDTPTTAQEHHDVWTAPDNYDGPIEFGADIWVSYNKFVVNVTTAYISIPGK